jgi:hypothetical protein
VIRTFRTFDPKKGTPEPNVTPEELPESKIEHTETNSGKEHEREISIKQEVCHSGEKQNKPENMPAIKLWIRRSVVRVHPAVPLIFHELS